MTNDFPTDPNAETIGSPSDDSGGGSVPELGKFVTTGMPSEIGRYKILGVIASGGMGVVYEAMQEAPRRRVALKIIKAGAGSEMALRRFQFEAQTLAKLSHPNIAQIFEAGTWESENGESPFFAMEYIPGAMAFVEYAQKRDLSIKERLELFGKICDAVHHGHQKGVIHRDLKPDNILVDNQGEPKIIDFGVARATDADLAITTMQTTMGQLIGTLQYMSPEQCDANPDRIDTRSDVYALGVILFELLSGKLPYDLKRQAIHEAVRVIKEQRPESLGTISATLRGDIDTIALKAMEKDRERRYNSASELASDIQHYLNNEPILARPLSIGYQLRLFTKKYKRTCAAAILLTISIVLGIIGTTWGMVEANHQRALVEDRNIALESSVDLLIVGVKDVVQDLGNSAEVQRMLLDIARMNIDAMKQGDEATPMQQIDLAQLLIRNAKSLIAISGVGFGNVDEARVALEEAQQIISSIDDSVLTQEYVIGVARLKLDIWKYFAEVARTQARLETNKDAKNAALQQAAQMYREREQAGKQYYDDTGDIKGIDVQKSSLQGLGNVLVLLEETEEAQNAFKNGLTYARTLLEKDPMSTRRQRGVAIALYGLSKQMSSHNPEVALAQLNEAVKITRSVNRAEPNHARRPRDLAFMLSLRGQLLIAMGENQEAGIKDCKESIELLTLRAVESPRELTSQSDFDDQVTGMVTTMLNANLLEEGKAMLVETINQLTCIASAEELAGRTQWSDILLRLQERSDVFVTVVAE